MASSFVFLEIKDPPAVQVLSDLRTIFRRRTSNSPIHITVRGPYKNTPNHDKLEQLWHLVEGEGLLLNGIGRFAFPEKDVVFLRSHSKVIRKLWWKRDFPIIRFGFNPHITLFEGPTLQAEEIETFLRKERIELFCRQLSLTLYETWTEDLFATPRRTEVFATDASKTSPLINPYRWKPGVAERARLLMNKWETEEIAPT